jgi:aspartate racemase
MVRQVSVLGTLGTVRSEIYKEPLSLHGITLIEMEEERQERVHDLIYNPRWGLKSRPWVDPFVRRELKSTILYLKEIGAQAIILGCTELRFALGEKSFEELPIVDSVTALARALLRETTFEQLRPD